MPEQVLLCQQQKKGIRVTLYFSYTLFKTILLDALNTDIIKTRPGLSLPVYQRQYINVSFAIQYTPYFKTNGL